MKKVEIEFKEPKYSNLNKNRAQIKKKILKYKSYIQETQKISDNSLTTRFII
ncbi:hypothetical protein [Candidatus Harpocratesius sp.]